MHTKTDPQGTRTVTQSDGLSHPTTYTIDKHTGSPPSHIFLLTHKIHHWREPRKENETFGYWDLDLVLAVTALASAARLRTKGSMTRFTGWRGNRDVLRLALAGVGAGAACLVNGDGGDLQGQRTTRSSATALSTAYGSLLTIFWKSGWQLWHISHPPPDLPFPVPSNRTRDPNGDHDRLFRYSSRKDPRKRKITRYEKRKTRVKEAKRCCEYNVDRVCPTGIRGIKGPQLTSLPLRYQLEGPTMSQTLQQRNYTYWGNIGTISTAAWRFRDIGGRLEWYIRNWRPVLWASFHQKCVNEYSARAVISSVSVPHLRSTNGDGEDHDSTSMGSDLAQTRRP
ncbi:hypothetical protein HD554DRAFT_2038761 [Boletus coccyginus]|nr:hypothetical protein HD554DRAFT_2038761 [Boletus coccyginus]